MFLSLAFVNHLSFGKHTGAAMDMLVDRRSNYIEFEIGAQLPRKVANLWSFQVDCAEWLLPCQEPSSMWTVGEVVICQNSGNQVRFGTLVASLPGDMWLVHMHDSDEKETRSVDRMWRPSGNGTRSLSPIVGVLLPPGFGKTATAALAISRMSHLETVLYITPTGLLKQTLDDLQYFFKKLKFLEGSSWTVALAPTCKELRQHAESARGQRLCARITVTSYAILQRVIRAETLESFSSVYFDEAHTAASAIGRDVLHFCESCSSPWWRPFPRFVVISGSASSLTRFKWFQTKVQESFYISNSVYAANCLGLPHVDVRFCRVQLPNFCIRAYVRRLLEVGVSEVHPSYFALVWWSYERRSNLWEHADMATHALLALCRVIVARLNASRFSRGLREEIAAMLSDGTITAYNALATSLRHPHSWYEAVVIYAERSHSPVWWASLPRQSFMISQRPVELTPSSPISECEKLAAALPSLMKVHKNVMGRVNHLHKADSIIEAVIGCLRSSGQSSPPKLLLCLNDLPSGIPCEIIRRLCNYPHRNQFCSVNCSDPNCRLSHCPARFKVGGGKMQLKCAREKWHFRRVSGGYNGELFESRGLEATNVFLMLPSMSEKERARVVSEFNLTCDFHARALRPLLEQSKISRKPSDSFLKVLAIGDGQLEKAIRKFVDVPQLHISLGSCAELGWNFQDHHTEILSVSLPDADRMQQQISRIQRPSSRPCVDRTFRFSMIVSEATVEDFALADSLQVPNLKNAAEQLGVDLHSHEHEIRAAAVRKGKYGRIYADLLTSYKVNLAQTVLI